MDLERKQLDPTPPLRAENKAGIACAALINLFVSLLKSINATF
jgi:hypothetical protein